MIFSSFIYEFIRAGSGDTKDIVTIDMDFRALYQIPDQLVILGFASVAGQRKDYGGFNINVGRYTVRLIGNFNETHNIVASIVTPRPGDSIALWSGICFDSRTPFYAPANSKILMPPIFQVEFDPTSLVQVSVGDSIRVCCTIGYEIIPKNSFENSFHQ